MKINITDINIFLVGSPAKNNNRVRIKRIAIAKCDPFFNYRDVNVANSTKFAIPNFVRNISFLRFFFQVVTFCVLSRHFNTQ